MEIRVSGHQVDTGDALRSHVEARMSAIADRFFARAISAHVTFGKGPHDHAFICDIVAHVMHGVILKGSGQAAEAHPAFEQAADRIEKQLRRYNRRLKDRHNGNGGGEIDPGAELPADATYRVFDVGDAEAEAVDNPPIVAETKSTSRPSVSDAVMRSTSGTQRLAVPQQRDGAVQHGYRRGDGTIGWASRNETDDGRAFPLSFSRQTGRGAPHGRWTMTSFPTHLRRPHRSAMSASNKKGVIRSSPWPRRARPASAKTSRRRHGAGKGRLNGFGGGVALPHARIEGLDEVFAISPASPRRSTSSRSTICPSTWFPDPVAARPAPAISRRWPSQRALRDRATPPSSGGALSRRDLRPAQRGRSAACA